MNTETSAPVQSAQEQEKDDRPSLYGWYTPKSNKKSPRLFQFEWLAQRAANNHTKRHGGGAVVERIRFDDEEQHKALLEVCARTGGNVPRPEGF